MLYGGGEGAGTGLNVEFIAVQRQAGLPYQRSTRSHRDMLAPTVGSPLGLAVQWKKAHGMEVARGEAGREVERPGLHSSCARRLFAAVVG